MSPGNPFILGSTGQRSSFPVVIHEFKFKMEFVGQRPTLSYSCKWELLTVLCLHVWHLACKLYGNFPRSFFFILEQLNDSGHGHGADGAACRLQQHWLFIWRAVPLLLLLLSSAKWCVLLSLSCEVMRLKKSKDPDAKKSQQIDFISRLICTSKTQTHPLSGLLVGVSCVCVCWRLMSWVPSYVVTCMYTMFKKNNPLISVNSFIKCRPVFNILSLSKYQGNFVHIINILHLTLSMFLHYLVTLENYKCCRF